MDISPRKDVVVPKPGASSGFMHMFDGIHFKFPSYKHDHPPVINVNAVVDEQMTVGQKVADRVASTMGSWRFIITQASIMVIWIMLNSVALVLHFDGYPFILLNLAMSAQAAFATPLIMMSQNRQAEKDRLTAQNDYTTDCKGEEEIRFIMDHLDHQDTVILQLLQRMDEQHKEVLYHLSRLDPEMARRLGMDIQEASKEIVEEENAGGNS